MRAGAARYYTIERLRHGAVLFLLGRGLTAPLGFAAFVLIAHGLPPAEFALYAWLLAFGQLAHRLGHCGLNWVALHYVPYYRARLGAGPLRRLVLTVCAAQAGLAIVLAAACYLAAPRIVAALGAEDWLAPFRLYLAMVVVEAGAEFLRSCVFAPLLRQGMAQANLLVQQVVLLVGLAVAGFGPGAVGLTAAAVIQAQLAAIGLALVLGVVQAGRAVGGRDAGPAHAGGAAPPWSRLLRFAADNYAYDVIRSLSGASVLTMLGARLIGVPALATFGFARTLVGHAYRLLPAQLFIGLLRPTVIASYARDGDFDGLNRRATLILKISNCVLAAGLAVALAYGRPILDWLSGGRYGEGYPLLLILLLWLAIANGERVLTVVVNVIERPDVLRRASLAPLAVVPTALALTYAGAGAYGLAAGIVLGEALFVAATLRQLRRLGYRIALDARGHARVAGATLAATLLGLLLAALLPQSIAAVALGVAATLLAFAAALHLLRPFTAAERAAIERLAGRRVPLP